MATADQPAQRDQDLENEIRLFVRDAGWIVGDCRLRFLAAGEYNQNFLIETPTRDYVFRINHGGQLGLADQISYEFSVLNCVFPSGVTPRPYRVHPGPDPFGRGVMLMEFLPGGPLDYARDWSKAAGIFARVHALDPCPALLLQDDPIAAILTESLGLIHRHADHPLRREKTRLLTFHDTLLKLWATSRDLFRQDRACVVNTEVNSGNFLISDERACLVDWEKAVISSRYQDLAHFLAPTTTLWKTTTVFTAEQKTAFLQAYARALPAAPPLDELERLCAVMENVIIMRGLSWCFMAYYEYSQTNRALTNSQTWEKIRHYLDNMDRLIPAVHF